MARGLHVLTKMSTISGIEFMPTRGGTPGRCIWLAPWSSRIQPLNGSVSSRFDWAGISSGAAMNFKQSFVMTALSLAAVLTSPAVVAGSGHDHSPKHGGVVAEVKDVDYELVAKPDRVSLHVRDHGKAVDVSKATAKLTLLTAGQKQEVELKPMTDRMEATGQFNIAKGTRAVALVTLPGKPAVTARFELK